MANAIENLIARHPGLTAAQISQTLFANDGESERVNLMCRMTPVLAGTPPIALSES
jgi:hypothetical protein